MTLKNGSTICVNPDWKIPADCKPGQEYLDDSGDKKEWECKQCISGADCKRVRRFSRGLDVKDGWWRVCWPDIANVSACNKSSVFARCPNRERTCSKSVCANYTRGPVCALCQDGYFRVNAASPCQKCIPGEASMRLVIVLSSIILFAVLIKLLFRKFQSLRAEYGRAWRDIMRIFTINISFAQINSSLPSVIAGIEWPPLYVDWLAAMNWVNVDVSFPVLLPQICVLLPFVPSPL